ncbi:hypothetical protein INT43_002532 [Umbelopsis isabellina]|uniref:Uncharacterized protein n=1 Tax=Mortierella isabellina TaxID=91625 RepID=A0A8H7Q6P0_MORIS|nr:hypothetical protein INT43_002532 [Umbelopsis isabellina]
MLQFFSDITKRRNSDDAKDSHSIKRSSSCSSRSNKSTMSDPSLAGSKRTSMHLKFQEQYFSFPSLDVENGITQTSS